MPDVLAVLKDMSAYLEKADTTQEKAKISKPPKTGEGQKPIVGGAAPGYKPGDGIAQKEYVEIPKASPIAGTVNPGDGEEATLLKENEEAEEEKDEYRGEEEENKEESDEDVEEIKSLLKDIVSLLSKSSRTPTIDKDFIRKEVRKEADLMLRKMGFHPTRPDVVRLNTMGVDQTQDIKKSEDSIGKLDSGVDKNQADAFKIVDDLSKKSWREINSMRQNLGGFEAFNK